MLVAEMILLVNLYASMVTDLPYDLWFKKSIFSPIFSVPSYFFFKTSKNEDVSIKLLCNYWSLVFIVAMKL